MTKFILVVWFVINTLAILGFSSTGKSEFDPNMQLSQAIMSTQFEQKLVATLNSHIAKAKQNNLNNEQPVGYLVNIIQGGCFCEWLAKRHQSNLDEWASHSGFISININLNDAKSLSTFVPSTPAVLALDKNYDVIYFGPYSRGAGCFSSTGKVDELLANYKTSSQLNLTTSSDNSINIEDQLYGRLTSIIETDAKGCYCST